MGGHIRGNFCCLLEGGDMYTYTRETLLYILQHCLSGVETTACVSNPLQGEASLQNLLEMACTSLRAVPEYGNREVNRSGCMLLYDRGSSIFFF